MQLGEFDMDAHKVNEIIENDHRFISPFSEPHGYYIAWSGDDRRIDEKIIELYWQQLQYAKKNADILIQQGFDLSFYGFYGVNQRIVQSPADMCQQLVFESFVFILQDSTITIAGCLSNSVFMYGHYIEYGWDCDWNLLYSYIC